LIESGGRMGEDIKLFSASNIYQTCCAARVVSTRRRMSCFFLFREIVYSPCLNDSIWSLAHYSNSGGSFVLSTPIWARRISVVSRKPLSIVDVSVQPCNYLNQTEYSSRANFAYMHASFETTKDSGAKRLKAQTLVLFRTSMCICSQRLHYLTPTPLFDCSSEMIGKHYINITATKREIGIKRL
uniref:Ovule protein n=1 Tax=Toxocara canis TaxID=6265 RepID=A0A183U148_TOXCA